MQNLSAHRSGPFGDFATKILKNLRLVSAALAASVPVVLLANVLLLAAPHTRGIDFLPALRYAIVAPVCVIVTLTAVLIYRALAKHSKRPRLMLALSLAVGVAVAVAWFVPREESLVVEEFVEHPGLRNITLVMQDWGGPIGLGFAGRRPELVRRLILGSTWAWPTGTDEPRGQFSKIVGGPLGEFLQANFDVFPRLAIDHGIVGELRPDVLDVYARPFRPLHRRGIAIYYPGQITQATKYFSEIEAGLPRLADRPALIFWALQDPGFPRTDRVRFERSFPRHRTIELPDANHFFYEDVPELMIREMRAFLSSH